MATIERRNLPPVNPLAKIEEADRVRVYDIIRRRLADVITGSHSYFPDGVQRDERGRLADLKGFISSVESLRQHVDDPSDVLGQAINDLREFAGRLGSQIEQHEPVDNIEIPPHLSPTTADNNVIYANPDGSPFSPPSPRSPNARPNDYRASVQELTPQSGAVPGLVSGKPMPRRSVQPPIFFPI